MNIIHFSPMDIAVVRVLDCCARIVKKKTGKAVSVSDMLPIVSPNRFAGDKNKRLFWQRFCAGGALVRCGSGAKQLVEAAELVFAALGPLAEQGFRETGLPNVYAHMAGNACMMIKVGRSV